MPFLYATTHRKEGSAAPEIESFMPTHIPEPVDEAAQARAFMRALEVQVQIGNARQEMARKRNGEP